MIAYITKASNYDFEKYLIFNTLEELLNFIEKNGGSVIITKNQINSQYQKDKSYDYEITIYDDYVE